VGVVVPRRVARFNRVVTNRVTGLFAGTVPGFGVVLHRGRRSGRPYRTPVSVYGGDGGYVIPLIYGPGADWARNVLAAGGCEVRLRGRRVRLTDPRIMHDERCRPVPTVVRPVLRALGVADFLHLRAGTRPEER
jgi:deazaflavin-dependent oxidoreductase (nitroreductase family)